jgi:mycobactin peptide synthetase MbtF
MVRAVWLRGAPDGDVLFLTIHHLAVDVVSWRILIADLDEAWEQVRSGTAPKVMAEFTSYGTWSRLVRQRAELPEVLAQRDYWAAQVSAPDPAIGRRKPDPAIDTWASLRVTSAPTSIATTARILSALSKEDGVRELLLAALTLTLQSWQRERDRDHTGGALIALESHGRADAVTGADTSSTVGWFTTVFPVRLGADLSGIDVDSAEANSKAARALLDSVAAHIASIPEQGLDFGVLQQVAGVPELAGAQEPQVEFNYLGRVDLMAPGESAWSVISDPASAEDMPLVPEPDLPLRYALDVVAMVASSAEGPQLTTSWRWSDALFTAVEIDRLVELWDRSIAALVTALDRRTA